AAGGLAWSIAEWVRQKKPTMLGCASGLVAGLVAITPAAGFVSPLSAIAIGVLAGFVCYGAVITKGRLGYHAALGAFGVPGGGGMLGALPPGLFAQVAMTPAGKDGLFFGGGLAPLGVQALGVLAAGAYAGIVSLMLLVILERTMGLRAEHGEEREGL